MDEPGAEGDQASAWFKPDVTTAPTRLVPVVNWGENSKMSSLIKGAVRWQERTET